MELIIDTSSQELRVILNHKNNVYVGNNLVNKHQENLLPEIDKLLREAKKEIEDIDVFGIVVGPGSFTGIRLAVSTVKAFCYVYRKKKIVSINMLDLLNYKLLKQNQNNFSTIIKCTSSKYYYSHFENNKSSHSVISEEELLKKIDSNENIFAYNLNQVKDKVLQHINLSAKDYIDYLMFRIKNKDFTDYNTLEPIYMALSQAEEELLKKENNNA